MKKIHLIEEILTKDITQESSNKCKELCKEVTGLHKLTVDVLYAKLF